MIFASGLGIVLSLVFGCLLLAIIAELYYLLWWKKQRTNSTSTRVEDDYSTHAKELLYLFCWKKPPNPSTINHQIKTNATSTTTSNRRPETTATNPETCLESLDVELGSSKEFLLRALGGDQDAAVVEAELTRLHNRFLFTITEESKEDLESEDGRSKASRKGSRTRSLSDLIMAADTPFVSPLSSPPLTPQTNNVRSLGCYSSHGFNPLFETSIMETQLSKLRSSPPPKFKFLRDAEEKLYRRLLEEAEKINKIRIGDGNGQSQKQGAEEGDGSFVRVVVEEQSPFELYTGTSTGFFSHNTDQIG